LLCFNRTINAQFRFGAFLGPTISQVNGDNLRGFHHTGISLGLLGGYKISEENSLVVDFGFNTLGSNRISEKVPAQQNRILFETDIKTINVLFGYQFSYGNRWGGKKYNVLRAGLNFHRIIKLSNSILAKNFSIKEKTIESANFKSQFLSLNFAVGRMLSNKFEVRIGLDYGIGNLLISPQHNITHLSVYQLNFNVNYYIL
jgi:hypothetical protein